MANKNHINQIEQGVTHWNVWRQQHKDIRPSLREADLDGFDLRGADLQEADLTLTYMSYTNLSGAKLNGARLYESALWRTTFGDHDLRKVRGLETVYHDAPSSLSINTLLLSQGDIPEEFLWGTGVPDTFIEYTRSLIHRPIEYYTCFISYSSRDQIFAERLYSDLRAKRIRCWFALHDMKIGDKIRPRIDETIRMYDKLLLILSKDSVNSQWVEHEVETAIGKELEGAPNVLFPIRLDTTVMESKTGWAAHIRLTRHIGDFTKWKNHDEYTQAFDRLLRDLKEEE